MRKETVSTGKKIGRVVLVVVLILALLLGAVAAFVWSKLNKIVYDDGSAVVAPTEYVADENIDVGSVEESPEPTEVPEIIEEENLAMETAPNYSNGELFRDKDVLNILLIGSDERTEGFLTTSRGDINILVSINKAERTVKLVSFSRGIAIKMLDGPYKGSYEWLTNAHRWAGHTAVLEALSDAFKIELDRYVRVNFNSVINIVELIGGIEMELTEQEARFMNNYRPDDWNLQVGVNRLDGLQALTYARLRGVDDDWHRIERQRSCILAVVNQLKGSDWKTLNSLCDSVMPMIQTNLTMGEIAELIVYAPKFLNSEFDQMTLPLANSYSGMTVWSGSAGYALDYNKNNAALHEFLYGIDTIN